MSTVNASLEELEARRAELYARLAEVGDFRRGSISENYRRCGKPNCACARPGHRGHGPRQLWTRTTRGGKKTGRQVSAGEVDKVRRELDTYADFARLSEAIVEVNEAICEARPVSPLAQPGGEQDRRAGTDGQKKGSATGSSPRSKPSSRPRSRG
jgi:hypothetical protein